jgi:hypothetical protein
VLQVEKEAQSESRCWREGWVIAEADPHDRLELLTDGPQSDRST